jgi:hypothetical protein
MSTKKKRPGLSFKSNRRFGIEIEINAFDKRNRPLGDKVAGIDSVAHLVTKYTNREVCVRPYEHTKEVNYWSVKPDSSCGMEVVSPALRGWKGLLEACSVVYGLQSDPQISADHRCSVHVHLETSDLNQNQLGSVLAQWIKSELVFMDAMPPERKVNRYCQALARGGKFSIENNPSPGELIETLGETKYFSLNTFQMMKTKKAGGNRPTIEFRIGEAAGAKDAYMVKNWTRLLIHFVDCAASIPYPHPYSKEKNNDRIKNGLALLNPEDVFRILGFGTDPFEFELSNGLKQTRNWFIARLMKNIAPEQVGNPRVYAHKELQAIIARIEEDEGIKFDYEKELNPPDSALRIFCQETKF